MSNLKQFKRIDAPRAHATGADEMGLVLNETVTAKLAAKRKALAAQLGFELSDEMTVAYLLRDVMATITPEWEKDAEAFMRNGQKIAAIKLCREKTQMGLKEAKDLVEAKWNHLYQTA